MSTPGYAAPEVLEKGQYGKPSDIWALGCLLYAMMTVCLPYMVSLSRTQPESNDGKKRYSVDYSVLDLNEVSKNKIVRDLIKQLLARAPGMRPSID